MKQFLSRAALSVFLVLAGSASLFAQIDIPIPPIPSPPQMSNIVISPTAPGATDTVTVTATIKTRAPKSKDGVWGSCAKLKAGQTILHWTTSNVTTDVSPTWNDVTMTITPDSEACSSHINTYTVSGQIPPQASGKVYYYISAYDDYSLSDGGIGSLLASGNPTPGASSGWDGDAIKSKIFKAGETTPAGVSSSDETLSYGDPANGLPRVTMKDDLDIIDFWVGKGKFGGADNLFMKMKVQGKISAGSSDLSAANAYLVAILNLARPMDPQAGQTGGPNGSTKCDAARGIFAVLYLPNYGQSSGIIKYKTSVINAEKTCVDIEAGGDIVVTQSEASGAINQAGNELSMRVPFSAISGVTKDGTFNPYLFEDGNYMILAATANADASNLPNFNFQIYDVINGVNMRLTDVSTNKAVYNYTIGTGGGGGTTPVCGNGSCESGETATSCAADCGGGGGSTCTDYSITAKVAVVADNTFSVPSDIKGALKFCKQGDSACATAEPSATTNVTVSGFPGCVCTSATCSTITPCTVTVKLPCTGSPTYDQVQVIIPGILKLVKTGLSVNKTVDLSTSMGTFTLYLPKKGGDLTGDFKVDINDFQNFSDSLKNSTAAGDINGDGKVNAKDLAILMKNFNKTSQ